MAAPPVKKDLLDEIDRTALDLLSKIRAEDILAEKVKAFGEVVKWASARIELLPKESKADAKFAAIKEEFHAASPTPRDRRGSRAPKAETRDAPVEPEPDPDDGGDSDVDSLY